jgi:glycosyltransferase involved in cell wall biosynthesis
MSTSSPPSVTSLPVPPAGKTGWPWTKDSAPAPTQAGLPWPRITVVTPSFNQGQYLEETIRSVLLQGYPNLEYWVIDGGSTDQSLAVIQKYAPWLSGWVSEADQGQAHAIAKGFARATGTIFAWLNSDDLYEPGALATIGQHFLENPAAVLIYGGALLVNAEGSPRRERALARPYDRRWLLEHSNLLPQPTAFFRAEAYRTVGGLDETLHYVMDWDLWLNLGDAGRAQFIPQHLARMRIYPEAKFQSGGRRIHAELRQVIRRHGGQGLPSEILKDLQKDHLALALAAYHAGRHADGQAELAYVLENVPAWRGDTRRLAKAIADYGWRLFLDEEASPMRFARQACTHLPPEAGPPELVQQQALGLLLEAFAIYHYQARQGRAARQNAVQAMLTDHSQLRNRGLWSMVARSYFLRRAPVRLVRR